MNALAQSWSLPEGTLDNFKYWPTPASFWNYSL